MFMINLRPHDCDICSKRFTDADHIKQHKQSDHEKLGPYEGHSMSNRPKTVTTKLFFSTKFSEFVVFHE